MRTRFGRAVFILLVLIFTIALDQITKFVAKQALQPDEVVHVIDGLFILVRAENDGAFLSLFSGLSPTLKMVALIALPMIAMFSVLAYALVKPAIPGVTVFGLSCIVGGGVSNLFDRITHDMFVFDFMNMGIGPVRTGIFNIADVWIMVGIGIILFADKITLVLNRHMPTP